MDVRMDAIECDPSLIFYVGRFVPGWGPVQSHWLRAPDPASALHCFAAKHLGPGDAGRIEILTAGETLLMARMWPPRS